MLSTVDVRRQARAAGIRGGDLSLAAVEARRRQLWTVMSIVLVLVSLAAGATALFPDLAERMVVSQRSLQLTLPAISLAFALYGLEKERALHRLTSAVIDEHVTKEQLSVQARQLRAALDAGKELSACLDPDEVVETLLAGAMDLFEASNGSLLMVDDGRLEVRASLGDDRGAHLDHNAIEAVAETHVPVRQSASNSMLVPLVAEGGTLSLLVLSAAGRRAYTDHDLSILASFGEYAAHALVNARRFEGERAESERLRALQVAQAEFSWLRRENA